MPLAPQGLLGIGCAAGLDCKHRGSAPVDGTARGCAEPPEGSDTLIDDLARAGHGVIMTMGKGGVGKTTVAAAIAVALADRGYPVHLSTTDPAAHVASAVGTARCRT